MAPKVNENDLQQLVEITQTSREDGKFALRVSDLLNVPTLIPQNMDYDLSRAVEYILNGEMATDKANQQSSNTSGKKGVLNTVKQYYTRSKSPLKGRKPSPAPPEIINVSEDDYEDDQMRLALQMSLQDSGVSTGGRSPNTSSSRPTSIDQNPNFGPAREVDYQESSWGMVVSSLSGQETGVVDNQGKSWPVHAPSYEPEDLKVNPEERKRVEGQPVVLDTRSTSGAWGTDAFTMLAGLMTILHNIPKAREAFLLGAPRDPGSEDEPGDKWWRGSQPLSNLAGSDEEADVTGEKVLREAARIMSFLDDSERAYGRLVQIECN